MTGSRQQYPGVLHQYTSRLVAFEHAPKSDATLVAEEDLSTLVFVGGLFDDLLTVPFSPSIAANLPPQWRFMQVTLTSSGTAWGTASLDSDVKDLESCIKYVRDLRPNGKVVLMGHSTGSQDTMHYLISHSNAEDRPKIDGAIIQAPASDREAIGMMAEPGEIQNSIKAALEYMDKGFGEEILAKKVTFGMFPVTARRWLSLMSPGPLHAGQDDMFSSDLSDGRLATTFGEVARTRVPLMILYSGQDQYVPATVNKEELVTRWSTAVRNAGGKVHPMSGVVPGLDHTGLNAPLDAQMDLVKRVVTFVTSIRRDPTSASTSPQKSHSPGENSQSNDSVTEKGSPPEVTQKL